jgi:hypothetical protein
VIKTGRVYTLCMTSEIQLSLRTYVAGERNFFHVEHFQALPQCRWYCIPIHLILGLFQAIPGMGYVLFKWEAKIVRWLNGCHSFEAIAKRVENQDLVKDPKIPAEWKALAENLDHRLGFLLYVFHETDHQGLPEAEWLFANFLKNTHVKKTLEGHFTLKLGKHVELLGDCFIALSRPTPTVFKAIAQVRYKDTYTIFSLSCRVGEIFAHYFLEDGSRLTRVFIFMGEEYYLERDGQKSLAELNGNVNCADTPYTPTFYLLEGCCN